MTGAEHRPAGGWIDPAAFESIAALATTGDGVIELLPGGLRLPGVTPEQLAATLPAADEPPADTPVPDHDDGVGWTDRDDDQVRLTAVVADHRLPARLAEFLAAVAVPVGISGRREIVLDGLDAGVAETVVRVLAPMGLIFDAESPWAPQPAGDCGDAQSPGDCGQPQSGSHP